VHVGSFLIKITKIYRATFLRAILIKKKLLICVKINRQCNIVL
jgi:hypothetical protein